MNGSEAYEYFVLRAQNIALSYGYDIVNWYETYAQCCPATVKKRKGALYGFTSYLSSPIKTSTGKRLSTTLAID